MQLQDARDFIMVLTLTNEVETLSMRQIVQVTNTPSLDPLSVVLLKTASGHERQVVIRETAEVFLQRCTDLKRALTERDMLAINHHLAPALF
ncbi:hypothetical protein [Deinococcus cellulosilyticus]|uniref:Uncharacterized protein n=1 Tax=Deinococcus cellulosilyticus (strain DSM 18568 / NBRC 106333 / KACC 11606 / 5516J-15) TaxID=1223518 RepID=A0A511N9M4_DEIC1|nr:hypothetical protein [Deinococcus cellulosilyticus]GEM49257.1 hypothetical protein DC3_48920 [Deinococcus cellulosilyticus NBRC 106333 = KACC 11606]